MRIETTNPNTINLYALQKKEQTKKVQEIEEIPKEELQDKRKINNEELVALYYNYQATQLMKDKVNTIFDSQEEGEEQEDKMEYEDIRELRKLDNRIDLIKYYKENQNKKRDDEVQVWA